jgi:hypothetical protein
MGKQRTVKSIFESNYGGGNISAAQYITEQICSNISKKRQSELPQKFWNLPEWNKIFRGQIPAANKLLKFYPYQVIVATLRDKRLWWLESLRAKQLLPILDEYLKEYQSKQGQIKEDIVEEKQVIARPIGKPNIINKLKGL